MNSLKIRSIFLLELIVNNFILYQCNVCNINNLVNCTTAKSKYIKLNNFNDFSLNSSFLIMSFDTNYKLNCLASCSTNEKCSHSIFKQNKCFICNENVIYYLSFSTSSNGVSLIYQKNRFNSNFKYTNGLVNYWPFYTNVSDSIGNAHLYDGFNAKLTTDRFDRQASALSLSTGYYKIPTGVYFSGAQFSILLWLKVNNFNSWSKIISLSNANSQGFDLVLTESTNGNPILSYHSGNSYGLSIRSNAPFIINKWQHFACVFSSPNVFFYLDGIQSTSSIINSYTFDPPNVQRNLNFLGRSNSYPNDQDVNADLDEIKIFNRALSLQEIMTEMNNNMF